MGVLAGTVAAILTVALWNLVAGLSLLSAILPAVLMFGATWAFAAWVWPGDVAHRPNPPESERTGPRCPP